MQNSSSNQESTDLISLDQDVHRGCEADLSPAILQFMAMFQSMTTCADGSRLNTGQSVHSIERMSSQMFEACLRLFQANEATEEATSSCREI